MDGWPQQDLDLIDLFALRVSGPVLRPCRSVGGEMKTKGRKLDSVAQTQIVE